MNIIYMHTHDTGRYISPYGHQVPTPNLMKLAKESLLFRHAYSAAPTCSPSRSALLSGMAPHSVGMFGLVNRGFRWPNLDYGKHLSHFLKDHGYETVLCGVQHEAPRTNLLGYEIDFNPTNPFKDWVQKDTYVANRAADYIKQKHEKPFFLSVGFFHTHREFPQAADINPNYVMPPFPLADTKENRKDMAEYMASAKVMDRCVGIVMDALHASGVKDNTLVIFTTDHGLAFPKMKGNLFDTGMGVALMMKLPGSSRQGEATDALVSHIDLFPTICDLIQVEKPNWLQGKSLLPILEGQMEEVNEHVFAEVSYHCGYEPMRAIRTKRYKYIEFFDDHDQLVLANIDDSFSKQFLLDHGYQAERRQKQMLFDLYLDPVERVNRMDDPAYTDILNDLKKRLHDWMKETSDPVLYGPVPKDEKGIINTLRCVSPSEEDFI